MASYPVENPYGVPETLSTARLRLPLGEGTLAVHPAGGSRGGSPVVPTAGLLVEVDWVVADTVLWTWDERSLADLGSILMSTGTKLAFVEPTAGLGLRHRVQLMAGPMLSRRGRHRHHRDIPAELRLAGLVVTTAVRFRDGIGHYVWGEARSYSHPITSR